MRFNGTKAWEHAYFNGLWCDVDGYIIHSDAPDARLCRWSFRKVGHGTKDFDRWRPLEHETEQIKDGDLVHLYCHSFELGAYRDIKDPPEAANPVVYDATNNIVKVFKFDYNLWMSRDLKRQAFLEYDQNNQIDEREKHLICMLSRKPDFGVIQNKGFRELDLSPYTREPYAPWNYSPATAAKWLSKISVREYFSDEKSSGWSYRSRMEEMGAFYKSQSGTFTPATFEVHFVV